MSHSTIVNLKVSGIAELTRLFDQFRQQIREMIRLRIDRRLAARLDASDIVQETYLRACQGLENYLRDPQVPPLIWIRTLGKQLVAETHRKQFREIRSPRREQEWQTHENGDFMQLIAESTDSIRSQLARHELLQKVHQNIAYLSELDREVILMRHMEGLEMSEIAEVLEVPLETAKKRYQRAIQRFREMLQHLRSD